MPDKTPEAARERVKKWYHENRDKALERVKQHYQNNKDNPDFIAKRKKIKAKSRLKHLQDVRVRALDYYYRNKQRILRDHKRGISFLGKYVPLEYDPRRGICSQCGNQGFTVIHHIMYDSQNPIDYTIELCIKCHKAEPNGPILI